MKKLLVAAAAVAGSVVLAAGAAGCNNSDKIYVDTNAYFAPFEYYDKDMNIVGVDVDIMELVGKKLGKEVVFKNTDFDVITDNVQSGKKYDCGAAGMTITDERKEKVNFSNPYFTSVQYVIFQTGAMTADGNSTDGKETDYILWSSLAGKKIGVQRDTTGDIYAGDEISSETGALYGTEAAVTQYDNAQLAVDAIGAKQVEVVIVDKLPAEYIVANNSGYQCYALYYDAETATEEQYAICVTKGNNELLDAINEVLAELGTEGINELVSKHLGLGK